MEIFKSIVTNVLTALYQPFGLRYSSQYSFCFFICMHIIQPMPAKESKPPALPGFAHSKIHCISVSCSALYFLL